MSDAVESVDGHGAQRMLANATRTRRRSKNRVLHLAAALTYAAITTLVVTPIAAAWGADYSTYIDAIQGGRFAEVLGLLIASRDVFSVLANGQLLLFFSVFFGLSAIGLQAATSVALMSFFSAFVVAYYTIAKTRSKLFLIFLFSPFLLDLMFFQVRNGFALALFMVGLLVSDRWRKTAYFLFLLAIVFHFAMLLFLVVYVVSRAAERSRTTARDLATTVFLSKVGGITVAALYVASSVVLHRYYVREGLFTESSLIGLFFFLSLPVLYILGGQSFIRRRRFEFLLSIVLLWLYPVFAQATRVFAASLPFHIVGLSNARNTTLAFIVLFCLLVFNTVQWDPLLAFVGR